MEGAATEDGTTARPDADLPDPARYARANEARMPIPAGAKNWSRIPPPER